MSAARSGAVLTFSDIIRETDPDSEKQIPIYKFNSQSDRKVDFWTDFRVDH